MSQPKTTTAPTTTAPTTTAPTTTAPIAVVAPRGYRAPITEEEELEMEEHLIEMWLDSHGD